MINPDILSAIIPIIELFEKLDIPYFLTGSTASSTYGLARTTMDIDIVTDLSPYQVVDLVKSLSSNYYLNENMIFNAIQRRSSFNLIHLETSLKVDIFISKERDYDREVFDRRKKEKLDEADSEKVFYLASPEDIILNKLEWFKKGGYASEKQWGDIIGVMKVQRESIDIDYLKKWAVNLDVFDLLQKAFLEAGILQN